MKVIRANCLRYHLPMVYVNQVGAQTEIIFDGGSVVADEKGNTLEQLAFFEEEVRVVEVPDDGRRTADDKASPITHHPVSYTHLSSLPSLSWSIRAAGPDPLLFSHPMPALPRGEVCYTHR